MVLHEPPEREGTAAVSDTLYASRGPSLQSFPQPAARLPPAKRNTSTSPPPGPRASRSESLATQSSVYSVYSLASPPTIQSIRRKPLPPSGPSLAASDLSRDHVEILDGLPNPADRFSRSLAVDSPTLYDFPVRQPVGTLDSPLSTPVAATATLPSQG